MVVAESCGIDTWSPCWAGIDGESFAASQLRSIATVPGPGRSWLLPEPVAGYRAGWWPTAGVIFAEGHPAPGQLAAPALLAGEYRRLEAALLEADVPLPPGVVGEDWLGESFPGFAGVRRLDVAVDLRTESSGQGAAIMAGVAALLGHAGVQELWRRRGRLETVYLRSSHGGRVLGRWYDKGAESSLAAVGRLLRAEDQRRWPQAQRRSVEELHGGYVRGLHHRRFVPLWRASKGVTVAGAVVIAGKLLEAVDAGELSWSRAERLLGFSMLEVIAPGEPRISRWSRNRRRRELQELGLVLADGVLDEVEVSLEDVLEACLDAGWERQG